MHLLKDSAHVRAVFAFLFLAPFCLPAYAAQPSNAEVADYADHLLSTAFPAGEPGPRC